MLKRIFVFFLAFTICLTSLSPVMAYSENEGNIEAASIEKTNKKFEKIKESLIRRGVLVNQNERIPVLLVLKDKDEYKIKDFSFSSIDKICDQISLSKRYHEKFITDFEKLLGHNVYFEEVSYIVSQSLSLNLSLDELKVLSEIDDVERISLNYPDLKLAKRPQEYKIKLMERSYNPETTFGRGELIAIIDSGFDTDHKDFIMEDVTGAKYESESKINEVLSKLRTASPENYQGKWINNKFPYGFNYANNTDNVSGGNPSHGTHVAAIAAASKGFKGQAPNAQILAMTIFAGENSGTEPSKYVKAIEDSIVLGASSINMSIGVPNSTLRNVGEDVLKAVDVARKAGVLVSVSTGNSAHTDSEIQAPKKDQPNYGTVSDPAIIKDVIAVASMNNDSVVLPYLEVKGEKIPYYPCQEEALIEAYDQELELVDVGHATKEEVSKMSGDYLKGKVALIERGLNRFDEKVALVASKGAKAAIIYDNTDSDDWVNMGIKDPAIMPIFVLRSAGLILKEKSKSSAFVVIKKEKNSFKLNNDGEMSYFSSWGPSPEFDLKPEITAIGGHVWAAQPGNTHGDKSGTSMAAPQVAGIAGLLQERLKKDNDLLLPSDNSDSDKSKNYDLIKNLLMSTAQPNKLKNENYYVSPRKQGAGLVSKENVLRTYAYVSSLTPNKDKEVSKINLGAVDTRFNLNFTVHNISKTKNLIFNKIVVTCQTDKLDSSKKGFIIPLGVEKITNDITREEEINLKPGESKNINLSLDISEKDKDILKDFINGYFVEGFIKIVSNTPEQPDIGLPYIGFRKIDKDGNKVNFYDTPVLERPIYEFTDLSESSNDYPKYYRQKNSEKTNPFTSLIGKNKEKVVVLGETTKTGDFIRKFEKEKIAFSPNNDGNLDYVSLRGVFISQYIQDHIKVYNIKDELVYEGKINHSGETLIGDNGKKIDGIIDVGKKNEALSESGDGHIYSESDKYNWDGKDSGGNLLTEGKYKYVFYARGVDEKAKEQKYEFNIILDKTKPELINMELMDGSINADIAENGSGVSKALIEVYDKDGNLESKKYMDYSEKISIPYDKDKITSTYLRIEDFAGNVFFKSIKSILQKEDLGSLSVDFKKNTWGNNYLDVSLDKKDYEIKIYDEKDQLYLGMEDLPVGKYKAKLILKSIEYSCEKPEIDFEITKSNINPSITFILKGTFPSNISLPIKVYTKKGDFEKIGRPKIRLTNKSGYSIDVEAKSGFGSKISNEFKTKISEGEWTAECISTAKDWKLIPEKITFTVGQYGKINEDVEFLYIGPKFNQILPQFDTSQAQGINENDIGLELEYILSGDDFKEWDRHKFAGKNLELPPACYKAKVKLPEGYFSDPAQIELDLREKSAAPKFKIYKNDNSKKGCFSINTRVDGVLNNNFEVKYKVTNEKGEEIKEFENLPYGVYKIEAITSVVGYFVDKPILEYSLGPSTNNKNLDFNWKSFKNLDKKGELAIWPDWGFYGQTDAGIFNQLLNGKPYIYKLRRIDKKQNDLEFKMPYPGYNQRINIQDIPYGVYSLNVDLSEINGYYVDKPTSQIVISKDRSTLNIKYGKTPYPIKDYTISLNNSAGIKITSNKSTSKEGEFVELNYSGNLNGKVLSGFYLDYEIEYQVPDGFYGTKTEVKKEREFLYPDSSGNFKFIMRSGNLKVTPKLEDKKIIHNIEILPSENGTVQVNKNKAVAGEGISISAIANDGYVLDKILCNDKELEKAEFIMPDKDVKLKVIFKKVSLNFEKLIEAINIAKGKLAEKEILISQDGSDIPLGKKWVKKDDYENLNTVLKEAESIINKADSQEAIEKINDKLNEAISSLKFNEGKLIIKNVTVISLESDGKSETETTKTITLKLSEEINLKIEDINLLGAKVEKIEKTENIYKIFIKDIGVKNEENLTLSLKKLGYKFSNDNIQVKVYVEKKNESDKPEEDKPNLKPNVKPKEGSNENAQRGFDNYTDNRGYNSAKVFSIPVIVKKEVNSSKEINKIDYEKHWAKEFIAKVLNKKIMEDKDGNFEPDKKATRLILVKALAKLQGINPNDYKDKNFKDLDISSEDTGYINWAYKNKIVMAYEDGEFKKDREITREEVAAILNRYVENLNIKRKDAKNIEFKDEKDISDWAKLEVKKAVKRGLFEGRNNGKFAPKDSITRAEIARVIVNLMNN